jgi:2'-5' RNA ligase
MTTTGDGAPDTGIRAFLAFEIPETIKDEIDRQRADIVKRLPRARWVRPEGQHLTLKFLGETEAEVLADLSERLAPRIRELPSVEIRLAGTGFFPNARRPRVTWIGGSAEGGEAVAGTVDRVARSCGFEGERRRWSIHITQARIKERWSPDDVELFTDWGRDLDLAAFAADEVVLFSSDLRPTGAVYTAIGRFPLA